MAGLYKTIKKTPGEKLAAKLVGSKNYDKAHFIGSSVVNYNDSMKPPVQPEEAVIPMPDEDEIKRNKRRQVAGRGGGRASTILTDGDQLGPA